ncbi:MAG TPA: hypothetical protein VJ804_05075 [Acidimicrobiales bacterium]|nr:hypothetical protein [Acidimicrobiales bacterium]
MRLTAVPIAAITGAAGALWSLAGAAGAEDTVISSRIPFVPAETLPATDLPGSGMSVRIDPGDNEAPDPAPQLIITIHG